MLVPGHTSPVLKQQNTKNLDGTKNNHVYVRLGQILDKSYKKTRKAQLLLLKWKCKSLSCVRIFVTPWAAVHGILPTRILEWGAFPFSRGSSQPRDQTQVSCIAGGFFTSWAIREAHFWRARSENWVLGAKAGYCACPLHAAPPQGWANRLSHPSGSTPGHTSTSTPHKEQGCSHLRKQASRGTYYLFSLPHAAAGTP